MDLDKSSPESIKEAVEALRVIEFYYFDFKVGPALFYSYPKGKFSKELSDRVCEAMDIQDSETNFTYSFEGIISLNHYFKIDSEWARGKKEMCMVSIILDKEAKPELKDKITTSCGNLMKAMKLSKGMYSAFYKDHVKAHEEDKDEILSNRSMLKAWIKNVHEEIFGDYDLIVQSNSET